jgi:hypothetical protein
MRMTAEDYKAYQAKRAPKRPKFGNVKKVVNGLEFDSTKEARRWQDLILWQQSGQIMCLSRQVPFPIRVNKQLIGTYIADFKYYKDGVLIVEDVKNKATKTPLYE